MRKQGILDWYIKVERENQKESTCRYVGRVCLCYCQG